MTISKLDNDHLGSDIMDSLEFSIWTSEFGIMTILRTFTNYLNDSRGNIWTYNIGDDTICQNIQTTLNGGIADFRVRSYIDILLNLIHDK